MLTRRWVGVNHEVDEACRAPTFVNHDVDTARLRWHSPVLQNAGGASNVRLSSGRRSVNVQVDLGAPHGAGRGANRWLRGGWREVPSHADRGGRQEARARAG